MSANNGDAPHPLGTTPTYSDAQLKRIERMVYNTLSMRREWLEKVFGGDPRRDIGDECGYIANPSVEDYQRYVDRNPIAGRINSIWVDHSWQVTPTVYEDEDADTVTAFEEAWDGLGKQLAGEESFFEEEDGSPVWAALKRVDELSGIGHYGILLLGLDDGLELSQPVRGYKEMNSYPRGKDDSASASSVYKPSRNNVYNLTVNADETKGRQLLYLSAFPESLAPVVQWESNKSSRRYGQPTMYRVTLCDPMASTEMSSAAPMSTEDVHWTRVIHVADTFHHAPTSLITAVPRLQPVLNNLYNLDKLYGADAEAYWRNCLSGDTQFFDGHILRKLKDCVGRDVTVTCADGKQRQATVEAFGRRPIVEVVLRPIHGRTTSFRRRIRATPDHRWILRGGRVTTRLQAGDVLAANQCSKRDFKDDAAGFAHGFVFGDGSMKAGRSHYFELRLCGAKSKWFDRLKETAHIAHESMACKGGDPHLIFVSHNINLKALPDVSQHSEDYIRSFIDGWLFADSHQVKGVSRVLTTQNTEAANWFFKYAPYYGYEITGHSLNAEPTNYGLRTAPLHIISYRQDPQEYRVDEVIDRGEVEETFCVIEPETKTFVLEGGVVTGNCVAKMILETNPSDGGDVDVDHTALKDMFERASTGMQPYYFLRNTVGKVLPPIVCDPTANILAQMQAIAIKINAPLRVLMGSEQGKLAADQDSSRWHKDGRYRSLTYNTPGIVRPFVNRCIGVGVLPRPKQVKCDWPEVNTQSDLEKAQVTLVKTQALAAYKSGQVESIVPPLDYLTRYMGETEEEAQATLDNAKAHHEEALAQEVSDTLTKVDEGVMADPQAEQGGFPVGNQAQAAPAPVPAPQNIAVTVHNHPGVPPTVNVDGAQPANVTVNLPEQPTPNVVVNVPEQQPPAVNVTLPEQQPAQVVVQPAMCPPPVVQVDVAAPNVTVNTPAVVNEVEVNVPAPEIREVNVTAQVVPPPARARTRTVEVKRKPDGSYEGTIEEQ